MRLMRSWLRWVTVIFAASLSVGCGHQVIDTSCYWTFYIRPEAGDVQVVSSSLARQIVTHNERRAAACP